MYTVGLISSCWCTPVVEENLGVEDEVLQDSLVLAARSPILVDLEGPLERLCTLLATLIHFRK